MCLDNFFTWIPVVAHCSVSQLCLILCEPNSTSGFLSSSVSQGLLKLTSSESVLPSNHLVLCHPLLLLSAIFPNIRVFSEALLCNRWPKYWSFNFIISLSNKHWRLMSLKVDRFGLVAVQTTLKSLLQHCSSKTSILWHSAFIMVKLSHPYMTTGKIIVDYMDLCQQSNVSAF